MWSQLVTFVWNVQLKEGLLPFIKELREKGKAPDASVLAGTFDTAAQVSFPILHLGIEGAG